MATLTLANIVQNLNGAFQNRLQNTALYRLIYTYIYTDITALESRTAVLEGSVVDCTASTLTVTAALHANRIVTLNRAAGIAVTLPAATGTGNVYTFVIGTTITSNTTTITAAGSDKYQGYAIVFQDDAAALGGWGAVAGTSTVVTMDGTTRGGYAGDKIVFTDVASARWEVEITGKQTVTEATPFS